MRQKELEDRIAARKQKSDGAQDARMEKLETLCAAQESRLKKLEDMMTEIHTNMTTVSTSPLVEPVTLKRQKATKKAGARPRPNRTSTRTAEVLLPAPDSLEVATVPARSHDDSTTREVAADPKPVMTSDEQAPTNTDVEADCVQATQTEDVVTTAETMDHVDAAKDMAQDGCEEGATTEDMDLHQDVEAEESETDDDSSDGVSGPLDEKVSSPEADEQEVVDTIATLSIEKPSADEVS